MRTETKTIEIFKFDELPEDVQERVIENRRNDSDSWQFEADFIIEDCKTIGAMLGFDIDKIYYSGFCSQGDGACFEGSFEYKKGCLKAVKAYAPMDKDLHAIAESWQALQKKHFYRVHGSCKQSGHYMHSGCTDFEVMKGDECSWTRYVGDDVFDDTRDVVRSFMDWIYSRLEKGYDYINTPEYIKEEIEANEYEFLANGGLA